MCQFPSWYENEEIGEVLFLTDSEAAKELRVSPHLTWEDMIGHGAIQRIYPEAIPSATAKEGFPCPPEIAKEIMRGHMNRLMRAAGYLRLYVDDQGQLHRTDGPAIVRRDGGREWYRKGHRHRDDGPAIEWADGRREWFRHGVLHRDDGPAMEWPSGYQAWYRDGKLHRDDGPAIIGANGDREWYRNGRLHREDGPAVIRANGRREWYRDGIPCRARFPAIPPAIPPAMRP
ncbi:MAG TPA: hypothetical protein ENN87_04655 [Phycisphaerales bacterium]|nr:hypothetical protein [Phycisphaerales bacterium]